VGRRAGGCERECGDESIREGERRRLARQRDYANKSSFRSFSETSFISGVSGNNN